MENVLYQKTIVPARESQDGESPTILYVTREANGCAVLLASYDQEHGGGEMLKWFPHYWQNQAIEYGVNLAEEMLIERHNAAGAALKGAA